MTSVLTKEDVIARLSNLHKPVTEIPNGSPELWAYREAASVLSSFDPTTLQPVGRKRKTKQNEVFQLVGDTYISYNSRNEPIWSLRNDVRRAALMRLGTSTKMQLALAANPGRMRDTLQVLFESYIRNDARPLISMQKDELACALQSAQWLKGILPGVPSEDAIRKQLDLVNLTAPFQALVGDHFRGRKLELESLRQFVFEPDSTHPPYLAICGIGGAGKSTLVAKFILDNRTGQANHQLPFAYLDFDRPSLSVEQ